MEKKYQLNPDWVLNQGSGADMFFPKKELSKNEKDLMDNFRFIGDDRKKELLITSKILRGQHQKVIDMERELE